jgi:hypothetical protein
MILDARDNDIDFEALLPAVELLTKTPVHLYRMALGGYWWFFWVGKNLKAGEGPYFYLHENGNLQIVVVEGRPIVEKLASLFQQLQT